MSSSQVNRSHGGLWVRSLGMILSFGAIMTVEACADSKSGSVAVKGGTHQKSPLATAIGRCALSIPTASEEASLTADGSSTPRASVDASPSAPLQVCAAVGPPGPGGAYVYKPQEFKTFYQVLSPQPVQLDASGEARETVVPAAAVVASSSPTGLRTRARAPLTPIRPGAAASSLPTVRLRPSITIFQNPSNSASNAKSDARPTEVEGDARVRLIDLLNASCSWKIQKLFARSSRKLLNESGARLDLVFVGPPAKAAADEGAEQHPVIELEALPLSAADLAAGADAQYRFKIWPEGHLFGRSHGSATDSASAATDDTNEAFCEDLAKMTGLLLGLPDANIVDGKCQDDATPAKADQAFDVMRRNGFHPATGGRTRTTAPPPTDAGGKLPPAKKLPSPFWTFAALPWSQAQLAKIYEPVCPGLSVTP